MAVGISLTRGLVTLVDEVDVPLISGRKWSAKPALSQNGRYYAAASVCRPRETTIYMHRLILGAKNGEIVDHINRNSLDNRRANLRITNLSMNGQNSDRTIGCAGYRGIQFNGSRYRATLYVNGTRTNLGTFSSPVEAARAWDEAVRQAYGPHAYLNFPTERGQAA